MKTTNKDEGSSDWAQEKIERTWFKSLTEFDLHVVTKNISAKDIINNLVTELYLMNKGL